MKYFSTLINNRNRVGIIKKYINDKYIEYLTMRIDYSSPVCIDSPLTIRIETSNICNLKCITCPQNLPGYTRKHETMSMELFERVISEAKEFIDRFRNHNVKFTNFYAHEWTRGAEKIIKNKCSSLYTNMCILSNGSCVPCCYDLNGDMKLGNINTNSIKKIWNGSEYQDIRNKIASGKAPIVCRSCPIR